MTILSTLATESMVSNLYRVWHLPRPQAINSKTVVTIGIITVIEDKSEVNYLQAEVSNENLALYFLSISVKMIQLFCHI